MDKWLQPVLASLVLAIALALRWADPPVLSDLRALVFDQYQRVQPREYKDAPVKIVDIDNESLMRFGQWPWPRSLIAEMLAKLREQGAAVIAMDIVFSEPDRTAPSRVFSGWGLAPDDELSQELALRVTDPDEILAEELKRGNVVLGFVLTDDQRGEPVKRKGGFANLGVNPRENVRDFEGIIAALPNLQAAAAGNGAINPAPDRDAIVRRVPMILKVGNELYPSLVAEALRAGVGASTYVVKSSGSQGYKWLGWEFLGMKRTGVGEIGIGPIHVTTDPEAMMSLYDTGPRPERFIPAWKILKGEPQDLQRKIVFVGTSAPGLLDLRSSPNASAIPGV